MPGTVSIKDRIKGAKRQRQVHRINLSGEKVAEIQQLEETLEDLRDRERESSAVKRLGGPDSSDSARVAQRIKDLEAEMANGWIELTLEAQPYTAWREFKVANPKDENDAQDEQTDFHFDALVTDFMRKCVVEPEMDDEDWDGLMGVAAPADLRDLGLRVFMMHERELSIPKSLRASAVLARISDDSEPPAPGVSASDDSPGGSLSSSTSSTTSPDNLVDLPTPTPSSSPESPSGTTSSEAARRA